MSSIEREIRHFHVVVVQSGQRNVQKTWCTCKVAVLLTFVLRSRCRLRRWILKSLMTLVRVRAS